MFEWITEIVRRMGYGGVALLTLLENVFPPIPSELVIPLAGFVASEGGLGLGLVIAAGRAGSLAGALLCTSWDAVSANRGSAPGSSGTGSG